MREARSRSSLISSSLSADVRRTKLRRYRLDSYGRVPASLEAPLGLRSGGLVNELEILKQIYARQVAYVSANPQVLANSNRQQEFFEFMAYVDSKFALDIIIEREI